GVRQCPVQPADRACAGHDALCRPYCYGEPDAGRCDARRGRANIGGGAPTRSTLPCGPRPLTASRCIEPAGRHQSAKTLLIGAEPYVIIIVSPIPSLKTPAARPVAVPSIAICVPAPPVIMIVFGLCLTV